MCNFSCKLIASILVSKLKKFLPKLIIAEQGAFVFGRSISDNNLLVQETLYSMAYSSKGGLLMSLKVDMERIYYRMNWDFVELVLKKFGF